MSSSRDRKRAASKSDNDDKDDLRVKICIELDGEEP